MTDEKKNNGILSKFFGALKLNFVGEILHNVGGRKAGLVVLGVYGIVRIVEAAGGNVAVGLGLACLGIGISTGLGALAIAWEDKSKPKSVPVK